MTTLPNTVTAYSEHAAKEFLQTVIFIDDRIYNRKSGTVSEPTTLFAPKQRKKAVKSADKEVREKAIVAASSDNDPDDFSPHDILMNPQELFLNKIQIQP